MAYPPPWQGHPGVHPPRYAPRPAPGPRRPDRSWIVALVIVAAVAACLIAVSGIYHVMKLASPTPQRDFTVVFEIGGTAQSAHLNFGWPDHEMEPSDFETWPTHSSPWRREVSFRAPDDLPVRVDLVAFAAGEKGGVTCRISVDGRTVAEDLGDDDIARCEGDARKLLAPTTGATPAPASTPATGPPPTSDIIAGLELPAGSTGLRDSGEGRESWEVPLPYAEAVDKLRAQLPVNLPYRGLPWCWEHVERDLTMWTWGDADEQIYVTVNGAVRKGSAVAIVHKARSPGC
ncbi:hypothetical protein MPP7335_02662 [Mycolicibacterium parafortuitum]|uniref:Uncharacterized protein n=1 Tax=Mycolicibacterium parafortuitum TaxID=39692 RepID=A0A375YIH0_MYCPF|nr:hypothetical protein MPP7335_02662 [Mycolicibacterium parafortuitum]